MDLTSKLNQLASRLDELAPNLQAEEATKHALIMPFLSALGYDVFDPTQVVPEFTADVGTKRGEKVDYALMANGEPIILIECKTFGSSLNALNESQLFRYFSVTPCRIAILTDGARYLCFGDLVKQNIMDQSSFFEFDLKEFDDRDVDNLSLLTRDVFDVDRIIESAGRLFHQQLIMDRLRALLEHPDDDFIKFIAGPVSGRMMTRKVLDEYGPIVKNAWRQIVTDSINTRFRKVMESDANEPVEANGAKDPESPDSRADESGCEDDVVTTDEEVMGLLTIKAIVGDLIGTDRVHMRDSKSYCAIICDDNNRKPICRLLFNGKKKHLGLFDEDKQMSKHPIEIVDDLFRHRDALRATAERYA